MTLRPKIAWILFSLCLIILLVALIDAETVLFEYFRTLEASQAQQNLYRITEAVQSEKETLRLYATSFSQWDDAYQFAVDKNQKFIDANFVEGTFTSSKINIFIFFDKNNKYFYGRAFDLKQNHFIEIPKELIDYFQNNPQYLNLASGDEGRVGFLQLSKLYLLASMPVLNSQGDKIAHGRMVMGYFFLPEHVAKISHKVKLPLNMAFFNSSDWVTGGWSKILHKYYKINSDGKTLTLYHPVLGINGKAVGVLHSMLPRDIYLKGKIAIHHYLFLVVFLSLAILIVMLYAMKKIVLDRILEMSKSVIEISENARFDRRLLENNPDEIGLMGRAINHLLEIIEASQEQLRLRISQRTLELEKISLLNKNLLKEAEAQKSIEFQLREDEALLKKLAYYDELTGLPNRVFFYELLQNAAKKSLRANKGLALLFIDADKFKHINDQYGHATGDLYLKFIAKQMRSVMKNTDTLARLAGDEFVAILGDIEDENRIKEIVEKILVHVHLPLEIADKKIYPSISIGIAMMPKDSNDWKVLLEKADLAMYQAKQSNNRRYCFYHELLLEKSC